MVGSSAAAASTRADTWVCGCALLPVSWKIHLFECVGRLAARRSLPRYRITRAAGGAPCRQSFVHGPGARAAVAPCSQTRRTAPTNCQHPSSLAQSHMAISVVSTGARSAKRRDLPSTISRSSSSNGRLPLRSGIEPANRVYFVVSATIDPGIPPNGKSA
jgi:hypothetical protein